MMNLFLMVKQYYVIHIVTTLEHPPYRPTCHRMSFVPLSQNDRPSFNNAEGNMTNAVLQLRVFAEWIPGMFPIAALAKVWFFER